MSTTVKPKYIRADRALQIVRDILSGWADEPIKQKRCQHVGIAAALAIEKAALEESVHVWGRKVTRHSRNNQPCGDDADHKEIPHLSWLSLDLDPFLGDALDRRTYVSRYIDLYLDEHEVTSLEPRWPALAGCLPRDDGSATVRHSTVAAETRCQKALASLMREGPQTKQRAVYMKDMQLRFGVGANAFKRAWREAIKATGTKTWGKPGPKPDR